MNFKKFISGVSAFAIAASAFAGMAVTANAAYVYDVLYGVESVNGVADQTDFTGDDHEATGVTFADANNNSQFVIDGSVLVDGDATWTKNFTTAKTTGKVYFNATYTVSANNSNMIKLLSSNGTVIYQSSQQTTNGNANQIVATVCGTEVTSWVRQARGAGYRIELVIDLDAKSVNYKSVASSANGSVNTQTGNVKLTAADVQGLQVTKSTYGYKMDSVALYSEVDPSVQKYTYNVNYMLGDTVVKNTSGNVEADTVINAESTFFVDNQKYFITADEAPSLTVSATGNNTLNVPVRTAKNYNVSVNAVGDIEKAIVTDTAVEGESYSYAIPQYIVENGIAYEATTLSSDSYYATTVSDVQADISNNVTYTKKYENVVVADDLDGSSDKSAGIRASKGSAYNNAAYTSPALEAGTYVAVVRFTPVGRGSVLKLGDETILNAADEATYTKNAWTTATTAEFTVEDGAKLSWVAGGSNTYDPIDTVIIYKVTPVTPDPTAEAGAATNVVTYSAPEYDGEATSASVAVEYANMLLDKQITLTYNGTTKDVKGAKGFTGNGNIVVGVVIENVADANPVFIAGVK